MSGDNKAQALERLQAMPSAMREKKQWLLWRFMKYEGDKKPRKVPFYVSGRKRRGAQGSVEDRDELATFDVALSEFKRGSWDGVGFAFLPDDGLIGIDIDGAVDEESGELSKRCQAIVEACASYTEWSPSRRGVHIIVAGSTVSEKDNSIGLEIFCGRQFFTCTGEHWESTPAEVRPIGDGVLRRLKATVQEAKAKPKGAKAAPVQTPAQAPAEPQLRDRLEAALQVLQPDASYDDWLHVGQGLKVALGDDGFRLWDYWSSKGAKYDGTEKLRRKWESFNRSGYTEATVFKLALDRGWKPPRARKEPARPPRAQPKPAGEESALDAQATPSTGSAADVEAREAPPEDDDWRRNLFRARQGLVDCRENVFMVLTHHPRLQGMLGYDEFSHRVMKLLAPPWKSKPGEWTTDDDYQLGYWLARNMGLMVGGESTLVAGVAMAAMANSFHPVLEYLGGLPAWDGTERLAHWLHECLGAEDSTYTRLVGSWFLMGMVNRIMHPGCQMDYMVVLEGLQGKRKSTALRTLVGNDDWFADTPIRIGDKDSLLSLAGKWLYEVGELDSFNKAEVTAVKQYVSSRYDRVREPFARRPSDRPRSGVFAGSTNQSEYFKDPTGARRFWPVACDSEIQLAKLAEWRDQLFAEAKHRLASDELDQRRYWPTLEETQAYLVPQQERREIGDPWFERLAVWLESTDAYADSGRQICETETFTSHELLTRALHVPIERIDAGRQMATRVGICMHRLGWDKKRDAKGARIWRYVRPQAPKPAQEPIADSRAGGPADASDGLPSELVDA